MKIKDLISVLQCFDEDKEFVLSDFFGEDDSDLFKIMEIDGRVCLCKPPECWESVKTFEEIGVNTWYNIYDEFHMYQRSTGDYVNYKYGDLKVGYENLIKDKEVYDDYQLYRSDDFRTVGGLKKFFDGVPDGTPLNIIISDEENSGKIHSIKKYTNEYLTGTIDNVDYELVEELGLVFGVKLYGSDDSLSLEGGRVWFGDDEVKFLLSDMLSQFFKDMNHHLSSHEKLKWGFFIENFWRELTNYYNIYRKVNGSTDSNGLVHLHDKKNVFKKYIH